MRNTVGIFGLLCGIIVIWTVGGYGYGSTDDAAARWNIAFLFGVIAAGGLFGHAVAVRLWRLNRFWSIVLGLTCAGALMVNLSNSLGAIAGRASKSTAEITSKSSAVKDDQAELRRLQTKLDGLGKYPVTDQAALDAAKLTVATAANRRKAECGENNEKRGSNCKAREEDEAKAAEALTKASTAKASTDTAREIEGQMRPIRERLRTAGPVQATNVQGSALAKLFRLPDAEADFAVTLQNVLMAGIVEALIVLSMVAFELMRPAPVVDAAQREDIAAMRAERAIDSDPAPDAGNLLPLPRPVLVAASAAPSAGSIPKIMTAALEPSRGQRVELEEAFAAYAALCNAEGKRAVPPAQFVDPLKRFCKAAGILTKEQRGRIYLMNVRLAASACGATHDRACELS